jgi:hypothetical protein
LARLRASETIDDVDVHPTSLEDIFVAYMQGGNGVNDSVFAKQEAQAISAG